MTLAPRTPVKQERRIGLARALSKLGYCSRSQAFQLAREGRVTVNGRVRRDPETPIQLGRDRIAVDAAPITAAANIYLAMNKPRGIVTSASDEKGRATVYSLLPPTNAWLAPVGRLDKASEGLLLFTNDSEWAARLTDPASHLEKTYHVQISKLPDSALLDQLRAGIVDKGEQLRAIRVSLLRSGEKNSWLEIVLDEGKNRHIRRMFDAYGIEVLRLIRVAIGPLALGDLAKGNTRPLTSAEREALSAATT